MRRNEVERSSKAHRNVRGVTEISSADDVESQINMHTMLLTMYLANMYQMS